MKKILIVLSFFLLLSGCKNKQIIDPIDEFSNKVNKSKSYHITSKMEIMNDEQKYLYDVDVSYLKDDYYKVEMTNTTNNHYQVILKNESGLYVITPSLNKSFKFESNWPDNSSQGYILSSIVNDMKNDKDVNITENEDNYIIKHKVNYPNNVELKYQKVTLDKDFKLKKVEVYDENDSAKIKIDFSDIDLKASFKPSDFNLKDYIANNEECKDDKCEECKDDNCKTDKAMGKIENAIYPMYMPSNTFLSATEVVNTDLDNRIILTFTGDKSFVLVEEGAISHSEHEIIPVYGEPVMLSDAIGALSTNSMYWTNNNIDYYLVSDNLSASEMVFIASSLGNVRATIAEK